MEMLCVAQRLFCGEALGERAGGVTHQPDEDGCASRCREWHHFATAASPGDPSTSLRAGKHDAPIET
eukprot:1160014-Pelagomonas_calceolata.AAC.1